MRDPQELTRDDLLCDRLSKGYVCISFYLRPPPNPRTL